MESVIKKIFSGKTDERVHDEFVKFSKGIFVNRYLLDSKKQKDKWNIKTSAEFANFLVRKCLESVKEKVGIKGAIICTFDLKNEIDFPLENIKQFMGVKQYVINAEVESRKIISLMDKYPRAFFALSLLTPAYELKIKAKAPKSAKPAAKGDKEAKADFCSLKTTDRSIIDDLFFDYPAFSEIKIKHIIEIKEIELPGEETEPAKIRELALRKGTIKRLVEVDGMRKEEEKEFIA